MADEALNLRKRKLALQAQFGQMPQPEPQTAGGRGGVLPVAATGDRGGVPVAKRFEDAIRSIAEGVTLGFSDEIEAAARAALSSDLTFDEALGQVQERMVQIDPNARLVGNLVGGFGAGPVVGGLGRAAGLGKGFLAAPSTVGQAARQGAGLGAAAGAGFAEGGLPERAVGAAGGAVLGGGLGAGGQAAIRGATNLLGSRAQGMSRAQSAAVQDIAETLSDAGTTPSAVQAGLQRRGPEAMLADIPALRRRAQQVAGRTTAAEQIAETQLRRRAGQAGARIDDALDEAFKGQDLTGMRRAIVQQTRENASELYTPALTGPPLARTPNLEKLLGTGERGSGSAAVTREIRKIRADNPELRDLPDTDRNLLHAVRVALRDRAFSPTKPKANLGKVVDQLTDAMEDAGATGYKQAVKQYHSDKQTLRAFEAGRKALRGLPEDVKGVLEDLKEIPGDRAAFTAGVGREIKRLLDVGETGSAVRQINGLLKGEKAKILRDVLGDEYQPFRDRLLRERDFAETMTRVLRGSPTEPREQAAAEQFRRLGRFTRGFQRAREQGPMAGALEMLAATERAGPRLNQERALAQLLFATNRQGLDPSRFQRVDPLGALAARQRLVQRTAPLRAAAPGAAAVAGGVGTNRLMDQLGF